MENKNQNFRNDEGASQETENAERAERKEVIAKIRKNANNKYPVVMKSKNGGLSIIYRNRVEMFNHTSTDTFSEEDDDKVDDAYAEIEMLKGSNYKRVKDTTEDDDWRFK